MRGGVTLISHTATNTPEVMKDLAFALRQKVERLVMVVGNLHDGKPTLNIMLTDNIVECGVDAGAVVREAAKLINGGGGGQNDQQQDEQQNQNNEQQNDQNKNQDQQQDNKGQDDKQQDKNKQQENDPNNPNEQPNEGDDEREGQAPPPQGISREEQERMLDAIQAEEDKTQDKLKEGEKVLVIPGKKNW